MAAETHGELLNNQVRAVSVWIYVQLSGCNIGSKTLLADH